MKRADEVYLSEWLKDKRRKPLILRGARQVGKSTLIRQFASQQGLVLNEINLERHLSLGKAFATLDVKRICSELEVHTGRPVTAPGSLLFLDEIQAVPQALAALRYFHEELPELPVIAAGSLLEFTLADHAFSMPVGRIAYHHLGPMTFREFVEAISPDALRYLNTFTIDCPLPEAAHQLLMGLVRQYLFVGGMPEAIQAYCETGSMQSAVAVHRSIIHTYEDDFAKYARSKDLALIQEVFRRIPSMVGQKVKYVNFSRDVLSRDIKAILQMLRKARVCHAVYNSPCSGIPLRANMDETAWKLLFLDVGLMNYACGMDWLAIQQLNELQLVNEGAVAEQFIGQHLAYLEGGLEEPALVYWLREGRSDNAELDYVLSRGSDIFPVEVKAGKGGSLRSLHQFAMAKKMRKAFRFDANPPSRQTLTLSAAGSDADATFELVSLPLYAVCELGRLMDEERMRIAPPPPLETALLITEP